MSLFVADWLLVNMLAEVFIHMYFHCKLFLTLRRFLICFLDILEKLLSHSWQKKGAHFKQRLFPDVLESCTSSCVHRYIRTRSLMGGLNRIFAPPYWKGLVLVQEAPEQMIMALFYAIICTVFKADHMGLIFISKPEL